MSNGLVHNADTKARVKTALERRECLLDEFERSGLGGIERGR